VLVPLLAERKASSDKSLSPTNNSTNTNTTRATGASSLASSASENHNASSPLPINDHNKNERSEGQEQQQVEEEQQQLPEAVLQSSKERSIAARLLSLLPFFRRRHTQEDNGGRKSKSEAVRRTTRRRRRKKGSKSTTASNALEEVTIKEIEFQLQQQKLAASEADAAEHSETPASPTKTRVGGRRRRVVRYVVRLIQLGALACALLVASPFVSSELGEQLFQSHSTRRISSVRTFAETKEDEAVVVEGKTEGDKEEESDTETIGSQDEQKARDDSSQEERTAVVEEARKSLTAGQPFETKRHQTQQPTLRLEERQKQAVSFVTEAVEKIGPSVVRIDTETHMLQAEHAGSENGVPSTPGPLSPDFVQQGQGSGLIFSSDGLILTNAHVYVNECDQFDHIRP